MLVGNILGWIIAGLIVGAVARLLVPGKQNIGIALTIILGIVGAFVGGFISSALFGPNLTTDPTGTYVVETAWPGWIMAFLGGALILWLVIAMAGDRFTGRRLP